MGKSKLSPLVSGEAAADACSATKAFLAELEEARWRSSQEAAVAYATAEVDAHQLIIPLGTQHCVVLAVNYEIGVALIEYAGVRMERTNMLPTTSRGTL